MSRSSRSRRRAEERAVYARLTEQAEATERVKIKQKRRVDSRLLLKNNMRFIRDD